MKIICSYPGCKKYANRGCKYCEDHKKEKPTGTTSVWKYLYNNKWEIERKEYLIDHCWCVECLKNNIYTLATEVDHKIPHEGNMKLFWDKSNWQALCKSCHSRKTLKENKEKGLI